MDKQTFTSMLKISLFIVFSLFLSSISINASPIGVQQLQTEKVSPSKKHEMVLAQMNYCISSLTSIIHNPSISVLEREIDQLVNNLTMEHLVGLYEINEFRSSLLEKSSDLRITEEEKKVLRKVFSIQRDNMKWNAIANALNPTMLITGGGAVPQQLAFQTLLSLARAGVEYRTMQSELQIEELKAFWEIRKSQMQEFKELRKDASSIVFRLYEKYHLKEYDRITEQDFLLFNQYRVESDPEKRIRLFLNHQNRLGMLSDYYYELGMSYIDLKQYDKAKHYLDIYEQKYAEAPILRYNPKLGSIALVRLLHERDLSVEAKDSLIQCALHNLPSNSAALLQCSMVYLSEIKNTRKGLELICTGIDDPNATDKSLLYLAATKLSSSFKQHPDLMKIVDKAIRTESNLDLGFWIEYLMETDQDVWNEIYGLLEFKYFTTKGWAFFDLLDLVSTPYLDNWMKLCLSPKVSLGYDSAQFYLETHNDESYTIEELGYTNDDAVSIEDIEDIDCFKLHKELKYLFMDVVEPGRLFSIKRSLPYHLIKSGKYLNMSQYGLGDAVDEIIEFCQDNVSKKDYSEYTVSALTQSVHEEELQPINQVPVRFKGKSMNIDPKQLRSSKGYYLRIVFKHGVNLVFRYDMQRQKLLPVVCYSDNYYILPTKEAKSKYLQ